MLESRTTEFSGSVVRTQYITSNNCFMTGIVYMCCTEIPKAAEGSTIVHWHYCSLALLNSTTVHWHYMMNSVHYCVIII